MNKEFVPYEESLALKELGFDEPCFGLFIRDKSLLVKEMPNQNECELYFGGILAPTFSQSFKFFREKHGLGHMINGIGYESFIMNIGGILHIFNAFEFKTYEEAELACLRKLIEIAKTI